MDTAPANALVFFGATGDLACKKIFPSLQAMLKQFPFPHQPRCHGRIWRGADGRPDA